MKAKTDFTPAEGVTLENSLSYIVAVEEAAMCEYRDIDPDSRPAVLLALRTALHLAEQTMDKLLELDLLERLEPRKPLT